MKKVLNVVKVIMVGFASAGALVSAFCFGEYRGIDWTIKQLNKQNETVNEIKEES